MADCFSRSRRRSIRCQRCSGTMDEIMQIEALWDALIEAPEAGAGRVPVIQLVDAVPITTQRGTNYAPLFKLVCWVERDETVFGPRTVAPPGGAPIVVQASPSSHNLASVATPHAGLSLLKQPATEKEPRA